MRRRSRSASRRATCSLASSPSRRDARGGHMLTFALPAGTFHALVAGSSGRPLVFLHGFPDYPPTGAAFFAELAQRGHRVLAPWLRGYAPSVTHGPFDEATLLDDVQSIIERWSPGVPV